MSGPCLPVLQALAEASVAATAASYGWLVVSDARVMRVIAAAGGDRPGELLGEVVAAGAGTLGFAVASGQPLALNLPHGDPRLFEGLLSRLSGRPSAVLCVPCTADEGVVGGLELVKVGDGAFSFDDLELATLLASIAGVALAAGGPRPAVATPAELSGDLGRLAATDPARYAAVAAAVEALLARG